MVRPRRCRRIFFEPDVTYFKPAGVRMVHLVESVLTKVELEAVRLVDLEEKEQSKVAKKMEVSQPTLSRLLTSARKKIADALVNGKAIKIEGGVYKMAISRGFGRGAGGRGRMGGTAAGPGGECVCPKCKTRASHKIGIPCYEQKCPKCGSAMTRS